MMARSVFARFYFAASFAIALAIVAAALILIGLLGGFSAALAAEESAGHEMQLMAATQQEVWRAVAVELRKEGLKEKQLPPIDGLELPAALPALGGRMLRVASACWDKVPQRTQFRLECSASEECLPFLVFLSDPFRDRLNEHLGDSASSNSGGHAELCRLAPSHTAVNSSKPVVRAGDRATVVFHAARLRMTASVICLERGGAGEVIHARGPDGHVFRVRISGPGELEALSQ
jgi:hypothetical protein